jgi:hypothetical protein
MKQVLLMIAVVVSQSVLAADKKDLLQSAIIEKAIRIELKKPAGELTKADLEKVKGLNLDVSSADRFRGGARIKESGVGKEEGVAGGVLAQLRGFSG